MSKPRGGTSYRLSADAQDLLMRLADRLGLTKTGVLEMAIRKLARAELGEAEQNVDREPMPEPRLTVGAFAQRHTS
jgi:predicted transcriptional regulator